MKFNTCIARAINYYEIPNATNETFQSFAMPKDSNAIIMTDGKSLVFFGDKKFKFTSSINESLDLFNSRSVFTDDFILANAKKESHFEIEIEPSRKSNLNIPDMVKNTESIGFCNFNTLDRILKTLKIAGASGMVKISIGMNNDDFRTIVFRLKTGEKGNEIPTECAIFLQAQINQEVAEAKIQEEN